MMEKASSANQRKVQGFLINPQAQLRLFAPFLVLFALQCGFVIYAYLKVSSLVEDLIAVESMNVAQAMGLSGDLMIAGGIAMTASGILSFLFWIITSHRIFGPIVAIRRFIRGLEEGHFSQTLRLRKNDELKDVAEDLNSLAQTLNGKGSAP